MRRIRRIADHRSSASAIAEDGRARRERRQPRRDHGAAPLLAPAERERGGDERQRIGGVAGDRRGVERGAELGPAGRRRGQAHRERRGLLHEGVRGHARRQHAVAHAVEHRGHRVGRRGDQRLEQHGLEVAPQQFERRRVEVRRDRREERGLGHAVAAERVRQAACIARLEPVLPAQRLQRRDAGRHADDLAELHVRAGRGQRRRPAGDLDRRGEAVLVGAGPGREVGGCPARHGQARERRALRLGHRHHRARHRRRGQRPIDQQHRVDGAADRRRAHDAVGAFTPARRVTGCRSRWSATPAVTTAVAPTSPSRSLATAT